MVVQNRTIQAFAIAIGALLCASAALGFFVYQINRDRLTLETQISQIQQTQSQNSVLIQLRRLADQSVDDRQTLDGFILQQPNDAIQPLTLIDEIWASQLGVKTTSIGIDTKSGDSHDWVVLQFSIEGVPQSVRTMIQLLEQLPYVSEVTAISMRNSDRGSTVAEVTLQIALRKSAV